MESQHRRDHISPFSQDVRSVNTMARIQMSESEWNQNRYMLRQIIQTNIQQKHLNHKQSDILTTLDKIVQTIKPQTNVFSNKTELNKAILNEIGLYITELVTNENVTKNKESSYLREHIKQDNQNNFQNEFSTKKLEFDTFHKSRQPEPIHFEDDASLDDINIEDKLQKEIEEREYFDSSITNQERMNLHTNEKTDDIHIPTLTPNLVDYQLIETPVFSLSSLNETSEIDKKKKVPSSKPIKSILKLNKVLTNFPPSYSKWFVQVTASYKFLQEEKEYMFMIQEESHPLLSFINAQKNQHTSLCIEQLCVHYESNDIDTSLHRNLLYIYTFTEPFESFELNTNSILFMDYQMQPLQNPSCTQNYSLYKGECPFHDYDYDNKKNNDKIENTDKDITHIVLSTIPLESSDMNSYFSLFYTLPEKEKREKKISIQLRF